jgi:NAD(P)-dependent dehydrogenase (short-subunit alcohol dehydrogenase family)
MDASGQVAVVTGAGSGLGEATARALAAKGAKVAVLDVGLERAEKVAADIGGLAVKCDVASAESAEAAVAEVAEKLGGPAVVRQAIRFVRTRKIDWTGVAFAIGFVVLAFYLREITGWG